MQSSTIGLLSAVSILLVGPAHAADKELRIFTFSDYIAPKLKEKFEKETGIQITVDTFDSNGQLMSKLQAGGGRYDIVTPTNNFITPLAAQKLIQPVDVKSMPNYKNVQARFQNPSWDPEQKYTAPWLWGSTSISYRSSLYKGKMASWKEYFEPDEELQGKIMSLRHGDAAVALGAVYLGIDECTTKPDELKALEQLFLKQKPFVKVYSDDAMPTDLASGAVAAAAWYSGNSMRARQRNIPDLVYAFPKEGVRGWFDNLAVPADAPDLDNAKLFMNFMMDPENSGIEASFAGFGSAISGAEKYFTDEMKTSSEMNAPEGTKIVFTNSCSPEAAKMQAQMWSHVLR